MDGVHDMGGLDCFGKVEPEANEPVFHAPWEGRVLALQRAMTFAGAWNIDMSRAMQEKLPPHVYLGVSYYKRWALGMELNVIDKGLAEREEFDTGHALNPGKKLARKLTPDQLDRVFVRGSFGRPAQGPAQFKPGDRVRAKNMHPKHHTRLPRYVRGHVGVVELVHGAHVFPDTVTTGQGENPQWLYTVVFNSRDLWGEDADPTVKISVDAFEPYLEPA
jgi:nitrile hydratase beta subunit